jgi:hypothetical protein
MVDAWRVHNSEHDEKEKNMGVEEREKGARPKYPMIKF